MVFESSLHPLNNDLQTDEQTKQEDAPRRKRACSCLSSQSGEVKREIAHEESGRKSHSQAMIALHYLKTDSNGSRKIFPRFE